MPLMELMNSASNGSRRGLCAGKSSPSRLQNVPFACSWARMLAMARASPESYVVFGALIPAIQTLPACGAMTSSVSAAVNPITAVP